MAATGLIDHGWTYINMDDRWEGQRDAAGNIHSSSSIPDMKALAAYVHGKGLKIGLYSSPGPVTCAGADGSWQHESIRLEPLNPEFEAFELGSGDFRVIAEFVQVLET